MLSVSSRPSFLRASSGEQKSRIMRINGTKEGRLGLERRKVFSLLKLSPLFLATSPL